MFSPENARMSSSPRFTSIPVKSGLNGIGRKQTTTGASATSGASQNSTRSAPAGADQLLADQLARVGEGLQQPVRPDLVGPGPPLDEPGHFPLGVEEHEAVHAQEGHDGRECRDHLSERVGERFRQQGHHRSISGMTRSRLPRMDTASASSVPRASSANRLRFENPGARSLTR